MKDNALITLSRFSTAGEAAIYKTLLESAGIHAMMIGEYINDIYPLGDSWAGIELRVSAEDEERAREILSAHFDKTEFEREAFESEE